MPKQTHALDSFDLAILDLLQRDNRMPQREIAERVNLSAPAVQRRIRRLEDSGVIARQVAVLDPAKVGRPLMLMVQVQLESEKPELRAPLYRRIAAEPAVQQCYSVTGETDYLLVITLPSMEEYDALARRLFEGDDNVRHFKTSVVLRRLKYGLQLPVLEEDAGPPPPAR
ncbi:Lrp/AsnC family transcriptional regulator [Corticibacter populi]|uniref:Lrp/AsnC family transcriptional regulator n=1 Tax=Corticibacter populi TaxID=1550736 RepID=A0A3M6QWB5_9BURK|nr:Lrp/AsnC family transcriptional regulator [Corticibacter populi]RMX06889.1 Lrp/AsnC family transcriptional regulator [Corticibacter populi]